MLLPAASSKKPVCSLENRLNGIQTVFKASTLEHTGFIMADAESPDAGPATPWRRQGQSRCERAGSSRSQCS